MSRDDVREELLGAPVLARVAFDGSFDLDRPGWRQRVTPSVRWGALNEISFASLDPAVADAAIDAALEGYRRLGVRFRWAVVPGSQPEDLAERLERRGLTKIDVHGMAAPTAALSEDLRAGPAATPRSGSAVEIVRVESEHNLDEFTRAVCEGWGMNADAAPLGQYHQAVLRDPGGRHRFYLARLDGMVVGAANQVFLARTTHLMGAVVLPPFQGRGIYRALVAARLGDAAAAGLRVATTQAREDSSAPRLRRMGFVTVCRFPVFQG